MDPTMESPDTKGVTSGLNRDSAVENARHILDTVIDWYKTADNKAQILLSLDGAFMTFLISLVFTTPDDLRAILARFTPATWLFLIVMTVCLLGSLGSALACLYSRTYRREKLVEILRQGRPGNLYYFQTIAAAEYQALRNALSGLTADMQLEGLSWELRELSVNVAKKHRWVNRAFGLAVASLLSFLGAGITYLVSFHL